MWHIFPLKETVISDFIITFVYYQWRTSTPARQGMSATATK